MLVRSGLVYDIAAVVIVLACLWALVDCLRRPSRYFAVVGQLSKWTWVVLLLASAVAQVLFPVVNSGVMRYLGARASAGPASYLSMLGLILAGVYLVDTRRRLAALQQNARKRRGSPRSL
jgi:hypothetical protein